MPAFDPTTTLLLIAGVLAFVLGTCAYLVLAERKVAAWVQDRLGPNRVGPFGLLQPIVDGGKMFLKEDVIPAHVDRVFFVLAPAVAFCTALLAIAVVPFGSTTAPPAPTSAVATPGAGAGGVAPPPTPLEAVEGARGGYAAQGTNYVIAPGLDVGALYTFAVGSLAVYGVILAGWSANNKYSLLGSLRSSAQIISYEIPLGMSVVGVVLFAGSLNLETIVAWQTKHGWNVLFQPLAFLLFLTSQFAECNRLPFDLPEAEQELVGGYHTEYSNSLKLGLMLLSEYAHMITTGFLMSVLFFGGWHLPGLTDDTDVNLYGPTVMAVIRAAVLVGKMFCFIALYLLVRWTIPRFRFDQLMGLAWKVMIPLALLNLVFAAVVRQYGLSPWWLTLASAALFVGAGAVGLRAGGPNNAPRRPRVPVKDGIPEGATYVPR